MAEKQCNLIKMGGGMSKYSTSEVLTGDTWIDGKPIYRKVIDTNVTKYTNNADSHELFSGLLPLFDDIVSVNGIFSYQSSVKQWTPILAQYIVGEWDVGTSDYYVQNGVANFVISLGKQWNNSSNGRTNYKARLIFEYTKP